MEEIEYDEDLRTVALELMYDNVQKWQSVNGPTAAEIARKHNLKHDIVKKKLTILFEIGLVIPKEIHPRRWKFDEYNFNRLSDEDPLFLLITRYEEDDFERFYF